jgi:hypothetical protein
VMKYALQPSVCSAQKSRFRLRLRSSSVMVGRAVSRFGLRAAYWLTMAPANASSHGNHR